MLGARTQGEPVGRRLGEVCTGLTQRSSSIGCLRLSSVWRTTSLEPSFEVRTLVAIHPMKSAGMVGWGRIAECEEFLEKAIA